MSLNLSPGQKVALYEILSKAIDKAVEKRGKGPVTRGAVDALEGVIAALELGPGVDPERDNNAGLRR
jgi:hypothetical protein